MRTSVDTRCEHLRWWIVAVVLVAAGTMPATWLIVAVGATIGLVGVTRNRLDAGRMTILVAVWTYQGTVASALVAEAVPGVDQRLAWAPLALLIVLFLRWTAAHWEFGRRVPWLDLIASTTFSGVWLWILSEGRETELPALWAVSLCGVLHVVVLALIAARQLRDGALEPIANCPAP